MEFLQLVFSKSVLRKRSSKLLNSDNRFSSVHFSACSASMMWGYRRFSRTLYDYLLQVTDVHEVSVRYRGLSRFKLDVLSILPLHSVFFVSQGKPISCMANTDVHKSIRISCMLPGIMYPMYLQPKHVEHIV